MKVSYIVDLGNYQVLYIKQNKPLQRNTLSSIQYKYKSSKFQILPTSRTIRMNFHPITRTLHMKNMQTCQNITLTPNFNLFKTNCTLFFLLCNCRLQYLGYFGFGDASQELDLIVYFVSIEVRVCLHDFEVCAMEALVLVMNYQLTYTIEQLYSKIFQPFTQSVIGLIIFNHFVRLVNPLQFFLLQLDHIPRWKITKRSSQYLFNLQIHNKIIKLEMCQWVICVHESSQSFTSILIIIIMVFQLLQFCFVFFLFFHGLFSLQLALFSSCQDFLDLFLGLFLSFQLLLLLFFSYCDKLLSLFLFLHLLFFLFLSLFLFLFLPLYRLFQLSTIPYLPNYQSLTRIDLNRLTNSNTNLPLRYLFIIMLRMIF